MNGKEKIINSLAHNDGPVPIDFGATSVTGFHSTCVEALRNYYGLEKKLVKIHEPYQMLGYIDDDLKEVLGLDAVGLITRKNLFGFENKNWKEWRTPWGQDVLVPEKFNTTEKDGVTFIYPEGDIGAPASGSIAQGGFFFDTIIKDDPDFDEDDLKLEDNLEEFGLLTTEDLKYYEESVKNIEHESRAVVVGIPGTALGDVALVPAPFLKNPKGVRDIATWYMTTACEPDFVKSLFAKQVEYALENLKKMWNILGEKVDVAFICGTDFGTQISTFCSVDTFCDLWKPHYKLINDWIHKNTTWKTFKHSCGAIEPIIPHLIEAGFDIINPVQCSATGMDAKLLKEKYGKDVTFWGGGCDTQKVLPFGTPNDVHEYVLKHCGIFSKGGGFVFNAVHNIQANTPVENLVAMFDAVKEFNK